MRRLTRRQLAARTSFGGALLLLSGCGLQFGERGQRSRAPRVGFLALGLEGRRTNSVTPFTEGLQDQGLVANENVVVDWALTHDGPGGTFPELAEQLVGEPVDVIVTVTTPAVIAAARATSSIPIVSAYSRDLVDLGLVRSYARPGGNVTGTGSNSEQYAKLVELTKDVVPSVRRVAFLRNPDTPGTAQQMTRAQAAAIQLGMDLVEVQARTTDDIETAIDAAAAAADALIVSGDALFSDRRITTLPLQLHLPAIYDQIEGYVDYDGGGLLGYAPDTLAFIRRSAAFVRKILDGAKPGDLPVEQPMAFELAVNLKTAQMLGLTIPEKVLLQATQVIR